MSRLELLAAVQAKTGFRPTYRQLEFAVEKGAVVVPPKDATGWRDYADSHVDQFIGYLEKHSRKYREFRQQNARHANV